MKFVVQKKSIASDKDLLIDLEAIIKRLNSHTITIKEYDQFGNYSSSTIIRRFGSWNAALKLVGIAPSNTFYTNVELLDNIRDAWLIKGKQPTRRDMDNISISSISTKSLFLVDFFNSSSFFSISLLTCFNTLK